MDVELTSWQLVTGGLKLRVDLWKLLGIKNRIYIQLNRSSKYNSNDPFMYAVLLRNKGHCISTCICQSLFTRSFALLQIVSILWGICPPPPWLIFYLDVNCLSDFPTQKLLMPISLGLPTLQPHSWLTRGCSLSIVLSSKCACTYLLIFSLWLHSKNLYSCSAISFYLPSLFPTSAPSFSNYPQQDWIVVHAICISGNWMKFVRLRPKYTEVNLRRCKLNLLRLDMGNEPSILQVCVWMCVLKHSLCLHTSHPHM